MSFSKKWFVVINPTSGNGKAKKCWPKIKTLLEDLDFEFEFEFTKSGKHNISIIHNAVSQGFNEIICVGGDGTIHNTVNGIMSQGFTSTSSINVGVIPIGTGNDWVKTYDIPKNIKKAIAIIKNGTLMRQDIGKIEFLNSHKRPVFFNNLAGVGFDGYVVSKVDKYKHFGALSYLVGSVLGLFSFKNFEVEITTNSKTIKTKSLMVLVGLCKYSGGGMQLTESSSPNDGLFDISIAKDLGKVDILRNIFKLFNGNIVRLKKVEVLKSDRITILTKNGINQPFIQADGELIGTGHIGVSILPMAFSFYTK